LHNHMNELTDTHCHIQSAGLEAGEKTTRSLWAKAAGLTAEKMVHDAYESGVTRLICVGCELEDSRLAVDFVQNNDYCWASIGLHPHEAQHYAGKQAKLDEFASLVRVPKVVAVGECGLDYYYQHSPRPAQQEVLRFQIELAVSNDLPIIFHVREAFEDFWPIFDEFKGIRGVVHSFTDSDKHLSEALNRGLFIGVNGIATFAKNPDQLDVYRKIPLEHLVLETDAPFLTPTPYRGSINEPKRVRDIADFLAGLRHEKLETLSVATTNNARSLFGI
jgi:TatD DNase family protein